MSILTWNDQLLVGLDSVDGQHQKLVELINKLDELVAVGGDSESMVATVANWPTTPPTIFATKRN